MDWYAWLCRAGLHPDVALDYALLFARNELGARDVRHLDHELLASMGVAVAKHRIEILKLARRESSSSRAAVITALPWRATRLLAAAARRSARSALGRLRASVSSAAAPRGLDRHRARGSGGDRAAAAAAVHALATPGRAPLPVPARHRGGRGRAARGWGWGAIVASPVAAAARGGKAALPLPMVLAQVSRPVVLTSSCAATVKALPAPPDPAAAVVAGCGDGHGEEESDGDGEEEEVRRGWTAVRTCRGSPCSRISSPLSRATRAECAAHLLPACRPVPLPAALLLPCTCRERRRRGTNSPAHGGG